MNKTPNYELPLLTSSDDSTYFLNTITDLMWDNQDSAMYRIDTAIQGVQASVSDHTSDVENPHEVNKEQVGLGNVPNVLTNDQTPTFVQSTELSNIISGEKISVLFGKIMKWFSSFGSAAWMAASAFAEAAHTHYKSDIIDFPSSIKPILHKSTHSTGGSDELTPNDIGALAVSGGSLTGPLTLETEPTENMHAANKEYVDAAMSKVNGSSLLRDLHIMLNLSLGTSNIDGWADLCIDTNQINMNITGSNVTVSNGILAANQILISQTNYSRSDQFGYTTGSDLQKVGQSFTAVSSDIGSITVKMQKVYYVTDPLIMKIYSTSSGKPYTLIGTSTNVVSVTADSLTDYTFYFSNINLTVGSLYAFTIERTGGSSYYYKIGRTNSEGGFDGKRLNYYNGAWHTSDMDLYFILSKTSTDVVWKPKTATEPFTHAAICADAVPGTGSIDYYLSDDGNTWTKITAPDISQPVNFNSTSIYLKTVIAGNAALNGIAWGGY